MKFGKGTRFGPALLAVAWTSALALPEAVAQEVPREEILRALTRSAAPANNGDLTRSFRSRNLIIEDATPHIDLNIEFEIDSAELTASALRQITELAAVLADPSLAADRIGIAGHTDARGDDAYNLDLSLRRAEAVRLHLHTRHGIDSARIDTSGHGETRLKDRRNPHSAANRRVEIANLGPEGS